MIKIVERIVGGKEVAEPVCNTVKGLKESNRRLVNDNRSAVRMTCFKGYEVLLEEGTTEI